jgi:oxaloacetate decarboxylase alpha subunit
VEAGVDIIDTALSPLSMGTSQPSTEVMVAALQGTEYDTGLDLNALNQASAIFAPLREAYLKSGLLNPKVMGVDVNGLLYQVPGGMLSNLVSQLKQMGQEDKYTQVLEEVPRVRADAGYPPLVTPTSQIVGTQAVFNVIFGRYENVSKEFRGLVKGEYGKTPVEIDPEFRKKILGDEEPITCRPADLIAPELETLREKVKQYEEQPEDVLSYALFEQVAVKFFEQRKNKMYNLDGANADFEKKIHTV